MNSKGNDPKAGDERRRFFRIDDTINLSYQILTADELSQRLEQLEKSAGDDFTVMGGLTLVNQQMSAHLHRIEAAYPDVAAYLKALDKKVEMIGRALLSQAAGISDQQAVPVNISAGGMAFASSEALKEGALLELKILLLPSMTGILAFGEVVGCEKNDDPDGGLPYLLRIDFTHIRNSDQEVLIRHLLRRQGDMLRRRREERDNEH